MDDASVCAIDGHPLVKKVTESGTLDFKQQEATEVDAVILALLRTRAKRRYRIKQAFMFILGFIGTFLTCLIASVLLGLLVPMVGNIAVKFGESGAGAGISLLISSLAEEWESHGFYYGVWVGYALYLIVLFIHIYEITR